MISEMEHYRSVVRLGRILHRLTNSVDWQDTYLKLIKSEIKQAQDRCTDMKQADSIKYNIGFLDGLSQSVAVIDNILKEMGSAEDYLRKAGVDINQL